MLIEVIFSWSWSRLIFDRHWLRLFFCWHHWCFLADIDQIYLLVTLVDDVFLSTLVNFFFLLMSIRCFGRHWSWVYFCWHRLGFCWLNLVGDIFLLTSVKIFLDLRQLRLFFGWCQLGFFSRCQLGFFVDVDKGF